MSAQILCDWLEREQNRRVFERQDGTEVSKTRFLTDSFTRQGAITGVYGSQRIFNGEPSDRIMAWISLDRSALK